MREGVDIIIGTPGRIIDFYKQKILKTDNIKIVVIDEADRLLDLGFAKDMRYILRQLHLFQHHVDMPVMHSIQSLSDVTKHCGAIC